jgi:hypothetical protein
MKILEDHCANLGLSKTAVLRELIRKLGEENAAKAVQSLQGGQMTSADSTPALKGGACVSLFGQRVNCL